MTITNKRKIIGSILFIIATIQIINFARLNAGVFPKFYLDISSRNIFSLIIMNLNWPFKYLNYSLYYLFGWVGLISPFFFYILGFTFFKKRIKKFKRLRILLLWGFAEICLFVYLINYISFIVVSNSIKSGLVSKIFALYLNKIGGASFIILFFLWSFSSYLIYIKKSSWKKVIKISSKHLFSMLVGISNIIHKAFFTHNPDRKKITYKKRIPEKTELTQKESSIDLEISTPDSTIEKKEEKIISENTFTIPTSTISKIKEFNSTSLNYIFPYDELNTNSAVEINPEEIEEKNNKIIETFNSFGIDLHQTGITKSSRLLRFEFEMPLGKKLTEIEKYKDELAHRMGGLKIDLQMPIPGTNSFGIFVPRLNPDTLGLGSFLTNHQNRTETIPLFLGVSPDGNEIWDDATSFPHILIAGSTGSGKSVFLNNILVCLIALSKSIPINLILIDPKRVEFSPYQNIKQLACPIISDVSIAKNILKEAEELMEKRYEKINKTGVRNILEYNSTSANKMPYLFLIIDEFADMLLQDNTGSIKTSIIKLAQKSRAVGIHIVLATQRPSSDIIDGLIKANFPSRIAFCTSSKVDSRIILDQSGAENLLGNGDMLYKNPRGEVKRLQGLYISLEEIKKIAEA